MTGLSTKQRGKLVREIAARAHTDPFGNQVRISRETLDRWIRRYRAGGFEALVPAPRRLAARTDAQVLELAASLKRENPTRTVAQVARILRTADRVGAVGVDPAAPFPPAGVDGPGRRAAPGGVRPVRGRRPQRAVVRRRAARAAGRATAKPTCSPSSTTTARLVTGYRFGFAEDTVRLAAALQPALAARGVPAGIYVDNGCAFVDAWLLRACAKLGVRLVHSAPGRPQGRGKIERFFRTVREQFLVEVTDTSQRGPRRRRRRPRHRVVGAQPAVRRLGGNRIPPPHPYRDRAESAGPLGGRLGPARADPGDTDRRLI